MRTELLVSERGYVVYVERIIVLFFGGNNTYLHIEQEQKHETI